MSRKELTKRYIVLTFGLFLMTLSVRLTAATGWGTSPISTLANVFYAIFDGMGLPISFGVTMFVWNTVLFIGQIILEGRNFPKVQFLQIPLTFIFSIFLEISGVVIDYIPLHTFPVKTAALLIGVFFLAVSVSMTVHAGVVMNSGEGIVKSVCNKFNSVFGYTKAVLDISYVILGVIISLGACGELKGVGGGTVVLAVLTGPTVKAVTPFCSKILDRFYIDESSRV